MAQLSIPDEQINSAVHDVVEKMNLVPKEQLKGITWGIDKFREECCGGKGQNWVRTFIFDEFPETNYTNGGWVVNPRGGKKTIIFAYQAAAWMEKHKYEVDWNGKLEVD